MTKLDACNDFAVALLQTELLKGPRQHESIAAPPIAQEWLSWGAVVLTVSCCLVGIWLWRRREHSFRFNELSWSMLVLAGMLMNMSEDLFMPSLPAMAKDFGKTPQLMGLTVQVNLGAFAASSMLLAVWSLTHAVRTRFVLLAGLLLFAITSSLVAVVQNFVTHLALRFAEGLALVAYVLPEVIAAQVFRDEVVLTQRLTCMGLAYTGTLTASPAFGAMIGTTFGWRFIFVLLGVLGALVFSLLAACLPETRTRHVAPGPGKKAPITVSSTSIVFLLLNLGAMSNLYILYATTPYLLQEFFGQSEEQSGLIVSACTGAYASVTLIMLFLPLKPWNRLLAGAVLELLATVGFLIAAVLKPSPLSMVLPAVTWYASLGVNSAPRKSCYLLSLSGSGIPLELGAAFNRSLEFTASALMSGVATQVSTLSGPRGVLIVSGSMSLTCLILQCMMLVKSEGLTSARKAQESHQDQSVYQICFVDGHDLVPAEIRSLTILLGGQRAAHQTQENTEKEEEGRMDTAENQPQLQRLQAFRAAPCVGLLCEDGQVVNAVELRLPQVASFAAAENGGGAEEEVALPEFGQLAAMTSDDWAVAALVDASFEMLHDAGFPGCAVALSASCDEAARLYVSTWMARFGKAGLAMASADVPATFALALLFPGSEVKKLQAAAQAAKQVAQRDTIGSSVGAPNAGSLVQDYLSQFGCCQGSVSERVKVVRALGNNL